MADNARGIHVSPGIYSKETELTYAVKSLGITKLGLVGETLRGPAFQPMLIENWRSFQDVFGGTSTEKFRESLYPKYELPYIAKSYLKESNQLQVCRVLGFSGYNAGPAWAITAKNDGKDMIVAVLRSRGYYKKYHKYTASTGSCECPSQVYDKLFYHVGEVKLNATESTTCYEPISYNMEALSLVEYKDIKSSGNECDSYQLSGSKGSFDITPINLGKFKIIGMTGAHLINGEEPFSIKSGSPEYFEYSVTLNPSDKDYILKVLGTDPLNGESPIYVESLYDVALKQAVDEGRTTEINQTLTKYQVYSKSDYCKLEPIEGFIDKQEESLSRRDIGRRLIADSAAVEANVKCHPYDYNTKKPIISGGSVVTESVSVGQIYTVAQYTDASGKRHYVYRYFRDNVTVTDSNKNVASFIKLLQIKDCLNKKKDLGAVEGNGSVKVKYNQLVKNLSDGMYYRYDGADDENGDIYPVTCDLNDYKEMYRYASTPWFVSNVKGDASKIELNTLFRFHTISDGKTSNNEVKVSIQNIRPDEGFFDVVVRRIDDIDSSPIVLEKFSKCSMKPSSNNYIGYKIGSYDGVYESKSKYITVEVNDSLAAQNSVPCGFLGYPLGNFDGLQVDGNNHENVISPIIKYNLNYDVDIKNRKQYFGLSNIVGVDIDMFTYKGKSAYGQLPQYLSNGFHLDSRMNLDDYGVDKPKISVDGVVGYKFDAVSTNNRTIVLAETPLIGSEMEMSGSIYEMPDLRKFTAYFYGGFDGWDEYREYRSNTDDFKLSKYKGQYDEASGEGISFDRLENTETMKLNQNGITSDWYAYLSAYRQFANPEEYDINVFATPGIDLVNNTLLAQEVIEMLEEERADSIYVATTPDKPFGVADYVDEMYNEQDIVSEIEDTEIDSNYTCTYYPWVKYEDVDNSSYIYLPPTKDVVRNMAYCDNKYSPWFAPAGTERGVVDCVRAHKITKLSGEDTLYEGRINPIKTFASEGVLIWGQKNLQIAESQLNRISVRRLLLRMRKLIAIGCIGLIFEPNDATAKAKFLSIVTPIMDNIKANRGISDYRIEVNDTVESRERRELPAKIFFKPINCLEYIDLNFIVTPEGLSFDDI